MIINTLIVDDSALARTIIRDFLEADKTFNIIGEAVDGEDAIEKIISMNPDLVTLDIEMPKKNGFEVIETVMKENPVPIVVITNHDTAKTAYEATVMGALEFYPKDVFSSSLSREKQKAVYDTLKRISGVKAHPGTASPMAAAQENTLFIEREINAVVIASSTGGPRALSKFVSMLPADFPVPVVIVQHNSSGFDKGFTQWLDTYTALNVKLAEEGEAPRPGNIYIARTDRHLELRDTGQNCIFCYNDDEPECNQKPAADVLFRSAAKSLKKSVISVVLTGMGSDGASGTRKIHEMGGITLAQDEESSLIYGMPKAAVETGCVDFVLPLDRIPEELIRLLSAGSRNPQDNI
jgi:two-component system chemotaxis response regulator CheB